MTLVPHTRVGQYEILGLLGAGGMGEVYLARDTRLGREAALKVLPANVARDPSRLARLDREARAVAALNHPGIVTLYGVEELGELRILAMERVSGRPLSALLEFGALRVDRLLRIAIQMADAVAAAHEKGIVHRDLKPGNVMVTDEGRVKVLDFGLATLPEVVSGDATTVTPAALTGTGEVLGTVSYMAPEQLRGERVDARADIFAFGALLYEMASGVRPFGGRATVDVAAAILQAEPPPLESRRPDLPARLIRLIRRCLEKNPRDRLQSAVDLRHELEDLADATGPRTAAAPPGPETLTDPGAGEAGREGGRRMAALIAAGLALVALVVLAVWAVRTRAPAPASATDIRSIAVLPFDNMMHDASQDYFVDGVHEALITELAKLGTVRVISRNSVMRYKDHPQSLKAVAQDLGVDALIEGSVLRAGDDVRITAQLILGRTDEHVWADSYDRNLEDVLGLLSDVSHEIATEVQATLGGEAPPTAVPAVLRVNPDAYAAFLRGREAMRRDISAATIDEGLGFFEEAVRIDPSLAAAWSNIAFCHLIDGIFGRSPIAQAASDARAAAEKAVQLDPTDGFGLGALGAVNLYFDWQFDVARRRLEEGLRLSPHRVMIRHAYADLLMITGDLDASLEQVRLARESDPTSPLVNGMVLEHMLATRRYDEVIAEAHRVEERFPKLPVVHGAMADALWFQGRYDEARTEVQAELPPGSAAWKVFDDAYRRGGPRAAYRAYCAFLAALPPGTRPNQYAMASCNARAGDRDAAFTWLDEAYAIRLPQLLQMTADPVFDEMRSDERFVDLLERIGVPARTDAGRQVARRALAGSVDAARRAGA